MRTRIQSGGLEITERCNLNCLHCYKGDIKSPLEMKYEHISYFIDQFIKYGANEIVITGGEPLCHPDINKIIQDIAIKYSNIGFVITTNGTCSPKKSFVLTQNQIALGTRKMLA